MRFLSEPARHTFLKVAEKRIFAKFIIAAFAVTSLALVSSPSLAGKKCEFDDKKLIDKREGSQNNGIIDFDYESRVEKYTQTANRYIWCIKNNSKYFVALFRWGKDKDADKDARYFSAIVEPGKETPSMRTDSSDVQAGSRYIGYRRLDSSHWNIITADTLFNSRVGLNEWNNFVPEINIFRAQLRSNLDVAPEIDFVKLSNNTEAFNGFLKKVGGKIRIENAIVATIPTNIETLYAIDAGKYQKYDPKDFVRAWLVLETYIESFGAAPNLAIYLSMRSESKEDAGKLKDAMKTIQGVVSLQPIETSTANRLTIPKSLYVRDSVDGGSIKLISRSALQLAYVGATLSIESPKAKITLASLPVQILVSQK